MSATASTAITSVGNVNGIFSGASTGGTVVSQETKMTILGEEWGVVPVGTEVWSTVAVGSEVWGVVPPKSSSGVWAGQ
jgi:hypothetical protein